MAAQIALCQQINGLLGTHLDPWDLEALPEEWATGLEMWIYDLPKARRWRAEIEASMARLRDKNRKTQ